MIMFSLVAMSAFLVIRGAHSIPVAVVTLSAILDTTVGAGAVRSYLLRVKIVLVVAGLYDVLRFGARWHGRGHVDNELLVAQGLASDTQAKTLPILAGTLLSMILHHSLLWHLEMLVVAGVRIFGDS